MEQAIQNQRITKEMTIGEIIRKYPSTVEILQSHGIHCVGCHVSYEETIEGSFKAYNFSDEQIDSVIEKLNKSIEDWPEQTVELFLTKKAAEKIKELTEKQNKPGYGIRIKVAQGGCAGFQYGFAFENSTRDNDQVVEQHDVKLYLDQESFDFIKGAKIDFVESIQGAGFKVTNPNVTSTCGCGQSFG